MMSVKRNTTILAIAVVASGIVLIALATVNYHQKLRAKTANSDATAIERVIAMAPSTVELIHALGAGDRLVGVSSYCQYPAQVKQLPKVGGLYDLNLEGILQLKPDLVIARGASEALVQLCREYDIRLYEDPTDTLADLYTNIDRLGDMLGREEQAKALTEQIRRDLAAVRHKVAQASSLHGGVGDQPAPSVLLVVGPVESMAQVTTVGRGPYLNDLIEIAGGRNVAGDLDLPWPQLDAEQILARQPQVVIVAAPGASDPAAIREHTLMQLRRLGSTPAGDQGRVCVISDDFALIPSPRIALMAARLADCLYPETRGDDSSQAQVAP